MHVHIYHTFSISSTSLSTVISKYLNGNTSITSFEPIPPPSSAAAAVGCAAVGSAAAHFSAAAARIPFKHALMFFLYFAAVPPRAPPPSSHPSVLCSVACAVVGSTVLHLPWTDSSLHPPFPPPPAFGASTPEGYSQGLGLVVLGFAYDRTSCMRRLSVHEACVHALICSCVCVVCVCVCVCVCVFVCVRVCVFVSGWATQTSVCGVGLSTGLNAKLIFEAQHFSLLIVVHLFILIHVCVHKAWGLLRVSTSSFSCLSPLALRTSALWRKARIDLLTQEPGWPTPQALSERQVSRQQNCVCYRKMLWQDDAHVYNASYPKCLLITLKPLAGGRLGRLRKDMVQGSFVLTARLEPIPPV